MLVIHHQVFLSRVTKQGITFLNKTIHSKKSLVDLWRGAINCRLFIFPVPLYCHVCANIAFAGDKSGIQKNNKNSTSASLTILKTPLLLTDRRIVDPWRAGLEAISNCHARGLNIWGVVHRPPSSDASDGCLSRSLLAWWRIEAIVDFGT